MENGVIAGYPVVDVKVTLFDGSYHDVDSSEMAFKIAGSMASRKVQQGKPSLLEPMMKVEVVTPEEYMGDVMGDLNRRRGWSRAWKTEPPARSCVPKCRCPKCSVMPPTCALRPRVAPPTPWNSPLCRGARQCGRRSYQEGFLIRGLRSSKHVFDRIAEEEVSRVQGKV
jgi:hypothetical protein